MPEKLILKIQNGVSYVHTAKSFGETAYPVDTSPGGCSVNQFAAGPGSIHLHSAARGINERKAQREQARSIVREGRECSNLLVLLPFLLGITHVYFSCHPCRYGKSHMYFSRSTLPEPAGVKDYRRI